ncbi:MAG: zinc ribbon domain-containing protein [Nitrospinae bacterium]|nr:zinc ribbon domain-containing protein [Nitrospinota bacterium]
MPIYEYLCDKCGEEMEVVQKITDSPLVMHADCGGNLKKLISNSAFVLKGSGWYVTDYPSQSRKQAMSSDKSPAATESKPVRTAPAAAPASTTA